MASNVTFDILARDLASKTFDKVGRSAQHSGSIIGAAGKSMAVATGTLAVGGVVALGAAMVQGVKDAADYQTLAAKTAAVLKSTGNVAHQSVKGIQARAAALESLSGVDETIIINGQNVLATFTKVRDGVGKGNDIFNQATKASLNLSTALGTDMQSASILVGKALNDPVKGITALTRAGVSFTQKQKDQIKALVESGHTMQAQKLILKELGTEFGGAAKAAGQGFNGAMARARDAVGDAFRAIGLQLLPTITKLANYVATNAGPAIAKLGGWMRANLVPAIRTVVGAVSGFISNFQNGVGAAGRLRAVLVVLGGAFMTVAGFIRHNLDVIVPLVGIAFAAVQAFKLVTTAIRLWGIAQLFLNGTLVANPIGLVIAAIAILVGAIVIAYKHSQKFRDICAQAFAVVKIAALGLAIAVVGYFRFMIGVWLTVAAGIVHGAAIAFGWIPGLGPKLKEADRKMTGFKDSVNTTLGKVQKKLEIQLKTATAELAASRLAAKMHQLQSKSITIAVNYRVTAGRIWDGTKFVNVGLRAAGGPIRKGHPYIVGEKGPELIYPTGDGMVVNAKDTAAARAGGAGGVMTSGGGTVVNVYVTGPTIGTPTTIARQIQQALLGLKRTGGTELGLA